MRVVLKKLLVSRFGELPEVAAARIDQAGEVEVDRWIDGVLVAESIETLLRG
jgi:hypothetical protein